MQRLCDQWAVVDGSTSENDKEKRAVVRNIKRLHLTIPFAFCIDVFFECKATRIL